MVMETLLMGGTSRSECSTIGCEQAGMYPSKTLYLGSGQWGTRRIQTPGTSASTNQIEGCTTRHQPHQG